MGNIGCKSAQDHIFDDGKLKRAGVAYILIKTNFMGTPKPCYRPGLFKPSNSC